jgi:hypothetical protein
VRAKTKNTPYRRQGRAIYIVRIFCGVTLVYFLMAILKPPDAVEVSFVCTERFGRHTNCSMIPELFI